MPMCPVQLFSGGAQVSLMHQLKKYGNFAFTRWHSCWKWCTCCQHSVVLIPNLIQINLHDWIEVMIFDSAQSPISHRLSAIMDSQLILRAICNHFRSFSALSALFCKPTKELQPLTNYCLQPLWAQSQFDHSVAASWIASKANYIASNQIVSSIESNWIVFFFGKNDTTALLSRSLHT